MAEYVKKLIVGSRESALAVAQTETVIRYLKINHPEIDVNMVTMKTTGDKILDKRLDEIGGKGLFVKELDQALREGRSDLSVHSLKDMPMDIPDDLPVIGFSKREEPFDALILPEGKERIDFSKPIGTSSKRRILQLKEIYPEAHFESVRGNIATRLRKLDEGQFGAIILAVAGLKRLGMEGRISRVFSPDEVIPSAGQGILSLQGRAGEDYSCLDGYTDEEAARAAAAERAFVKALGGGCTSPIAAHASFEKNTMTLRGFFYDEENEKGYKKTVIKEVGTVEECAEEGRKLARGILKEIG
ncbi:MAG: hydroxymethylbilane synthase [Lachnospiraceae bacterium]|nr:hydroxymethylbilane synthase [Lachnospiraceae bacterium]